MVITVASHKGGVGKTTTALTLAHLMSTRGERVVLVDLDAPHALRTAASAAARRRGEQIGIPSYSLDDLPASVSADVVIDCPPDAADRHLRAALSIADAVIVPTGDSVDDLSVTLAFVGEHPWHILFTRILASSAATVERMKAGLRADGYRVCAAHITLLDAYKVAAARGTTVVGLSTYQGRRATREYERVLREIRHA